MDLKLPNYCDLHKVFILNQYKNSFMYSDHAVLVFSNCQLKSMQIIIMHDAMLYALRDTMPCYDAMQYIWIDVKCHNDNMQSLEINQNKEILTYLHEIQKSSNPEKNQTGNDTKLDA